MNLDSFEEQALAGKRGPALQWAYEELIRYAHQKGSNDLVQVRSIHIPRPSPDELRILGPIIHTPFHPGCKVSFNPWLHCQSFGDGDVATLGMVNNCSEATCSPFLSGNSPSKGSFCAWGGRGAVCFLNSIIGAFSNQESFSTALAAAISGKTVLHGLLKESGRSSDISVALEDVNEIDPSVLGHFLSESLDGRRSRILGLRLNLDEMRSFCSSLNHDGRQPMFQIGGEADEATLTITSEDIDIGYEPTIDETAVIILGCPHLSEQQINKIARKLAGRKASEHEVIFHSSKLCMDKSPKTGLLLSKRGRIEISRCPLTDEREWAGKMVLTDSVMLAERLQKDGYRAGFLPSSVLMDKLIS
ncbi:MAG: aconitase X [Candidatus Methanomethylophilaceae archaeon]